MPQSSWISLSWATKQIFSIHMKYIPTQKIPQLLHLLRILSDPWLTAYVIHWQVMLQVMLNRFRCWIYFTLYFLYVLYVYSLCSLFLCYSLFYSIFTLRVNVLPIPCLGAEGWLGNGQVFRAFLHERWPLVEFRDVSLALEGAEMLTIWASLSTNSLNCSRPLNYPTVCLVSLY